MNKQQQINDDILGAMKAKSPNLNTLRGLKSALTNFALGLGNASKPVSNNDVVSVVRKEIKKREDSIEQFNKGGRPELAANEQSEIDYLKVYLPAEMSEEEINRLVGLAIDQTGAQTKKDMGKAIKVALELAAGRVENKIISQKIGALLK